MISTGINGLDEMLGSGIPDGSRILYSLEPGVDGQLFMISTLSCALAKKRPCLVVLPNTTVDAFRNDVQRMYGARPDLALAPVTFFDSVDWERIQKGSKSPEGRARELQARIRKLCREHDVDVIFVYFDLLNEEFGTDAAAAIFTSAQEREKKITLVIEHLNLEGEQLLDHVIRDLNFDLVLAIRSSFRPFPQFNYFTLVHTSWADLPARSVPFIIGEGRVIPYIPRIVVTGPASSGKSTFVLNAADDGHSVDRMAQEGSMTTVALDFGWIRWKDFDITLYGTPGQERFDSLLPSYLGHAMGALLVIDATNADQLPRARLLIEMIARRRIPFAVAANKSDLPGTLDPGLIRRSLAIGDEIPLYQISAIRKSDVNFVLESLVDSITQFRY
ncbi:GTP-binding protein [Methanoregula formicica]|uniref:Putative GTPase n=1 Tax=Methanoregula formicica (strain DSM 22288 / NBRC 105244 / SMSP) TaxID=593750 RepID=L0HDH9_METFS|nr:GTP-binding protein [Methanoregula formicica]AGB01846.1 putative GTPase [Methanoregula formicica SMSP]